MVRQTQVVRQTGGERQVGRQTYRQVVRQTDSETDGETDRWGQSDRW